MIDGHYYRNSANEAVQASKLTWELMHVKPHVTTVNYSHVKIYHGFVNVGNAFCRGVCNRTLYLL